MCTLSLMALGCDGGNAGQSSGTDPRGSPPWVGGATKDFSGSCAPCEDAQVEEIANTDASALGFSPAEVIAYVEGDYRANVRWHDTCAPDPCRQPQEGCSREPNPLTGSHTELTFAVRHDSTRPTRLRSCPGREAGKTCQDKIQLIPLTIELSTSVGALRLQSSQDLFVEVGARLTLGENVKPENVSGDLLGQLGEVDWVRWMLWFDEYGAGADVSVVGPKAGDPERTAELVNLLVETGNPNDAGCDVGFPLSHEAPAP